MGGWGSHKSPEAVESRPVPQSPQKGLGKKKLALQTPDLSQASCLPHSGDSGEIAFPRIFLAAFRYKFISENGVSLSGGLRELLFGAAGPPLEPTQTTSILLLRLPAEQHLA